MDLSRLDFRPSLLFEDDVRRRFASTVCPGSPDCPSTFWLVVSFGRCIFKLDSVSVSHLLQAALGGFAKGFNVSQLADRVFRFAVSSKAVGFHIYNSKCIVHPDFKAFFNLWNFGGPNWSYEYRLFLQEKNANWWFVKGNKRISFANIVRIPPLTGANAVPNLRRRLSPRSPGNLVEPRIFRKKLEEPRLSVFKRLGTSSGARGLQNLVFAKSSGTPMSNPPFRLSPSVRFPMHNGSLIRRGRQGRDDRPFSNSNASLPGIRKLHWRPILRNRPFMSGPGPSASSISVKAGLSGVAPSAFLCHFCKVKGHLELFCNLKKMVFRFLLASFPSFESKCLLEGTSHFPVYGSWFRPTLGSMTAGAPPIFACFEEFARAVLLKKYEQAPVASLELSLGVTSPKPQTATLPSALRRSSENLAMAYRRVDPGPFLPPGFHASAVQHREIMVRSVSQRLPPMHEDWAIINIHPLPEHEVLFPAVRDVVGEYLVEHRRVGVRAIQRSHLGQVLVQFRSVLERDNLVLLGPQQYLDATFTAVRHNDTWNHRALLFNHECWLMFLGFPLDYRSLEYLQAAIGSFGRLILLEEDRGNVFRTLLRVRVTSLEEVPQFIVFSEAEGFVGDSWTVQCEIIQQNMLGGQAQDEDPIPPASEDG
jgi:hypothetical protein